MFSQHFKVHTEWSLRLHQATVAPNDYMLAGCLPLQAQLPLCHQFDRKEHLGHISDLFGEDHIVTLGRN